MINVSYILKAKNIFEIFKKVAMKKDFSFYTLFHSCVSSYITVTADFFLIPIHQLISTQK